MNFGLSFSLWWPFQTPDWRRLFNKYGKITTNKGWELEGIYSHWTVLFRFELMQTFCCDHAGFEIEITLFGFNVQLRIYDGRHWDDENRCWQKPTGLVIAHDDA